MLTVYLFLNSVYVRLFYKELARQLEQNLVTFLHTLNNHKIKSIGARQKVIKLENKFNGMIGMGAGLLQTKKNTSNRIADMQRSLT